MGKKVAREEEEEGEEDIQIIDDSTDHKERRVSEQDQPAKR